MFRVLIADDDYEDRELLKLEIQRALGGGDDIRFSEAVSVTEAKKLLTSHFFDLMTLDIEFDRMNEGIDVLPEIFETYPALNIIIVSGKLNKGEVSEKLFRFTKDNVLKGKRWSRHFDVLDKKDDKTEALRRAYSFAFSQKEVSDKIRELFLLAESYLERDMIDKCLEVYQKIQSLVPGEAESKENIRIFKESLSVEKAREYLRSGDTVVASLLLGYHIETELKGFTRRLLGRYAPGLYDCLKELELNERLNAHRKSIFQQLIRLRNKAIHHPATITEEDFATVVKNLESLEAVP
ncbi:MAG TPA: response regulator [Thermodesulfovibrionales bacterium]|nr:response regulator [Thermodesulfovibrionales bacterium]